MVKFLVNTHNRTDRQWALFLFAATFGLYLRTLAPGLLGGDAGEFQVAAWRLGLAHPTGYPLYLLLGSLWQHLLALFGLSPAYALNMLSAPLGAAAVALLYLLMMRWLHSPFADAAWRHSLRQHSLPSTSPSGAKASSPRSTPSTPSSSF
ncbi:MAG: DUF2723 domain-containing protein [Caldilineaceae bacterium]